MTLWYTHTPLDCDNGYNNNDEDHQILEALKIPTVQRLSLVVRGVVFFSDEQIKF